MATLQGKDALKNRLLIASVYDNNYFATKNSEGNAFVEYRLHPDDRDAPGQLFPELRSEYVGEKENPDGSKTNMYERRSVTYANQMEALKEAAKDNTFDLKNAKGEKIGTCYVVEADLVIHRPEYGPRPYGDKEGERLPARNYLVPYHKSMRAVDPKYSATVVVDGVEKTPLDRSFDLIQVARQEKAAEKAAKKETQPMLDGFEDLQVDAREKLEVEAEEPEMGM